MKKHILKIIEIILVIILIYSTIKIVIWFLENNKNNNIKNHTIKITDIRKDKDKYPIISTNFTDLLKENNDVKGWIQVPNTNINYPVVQYSDNDYYLIHNFNKEYTTAGWVFMDYRNTIDKDYNTIIYAHNRLDNSMFGTLKNTLLEEWHKNNKYIFFNTLNTINTYEVFSVYTINSNKFVGKINFNDSNDYKEYLNDIINKSIIKLNVDVDTNDKIITLYTCDKNNIDRTILHAKLIQTKK